jgi:hypothetical protein
VEDPLTFPRFAYRCGKLSWIEAECLGLPKGITDGTAVESKRGGSSETIDIACVVARFVHARGRIHDDYSVVCPLRGAWPVEEFVVDVSGSVASPVISVDEFELVHALIQLKGGFPNAISVSIA